MAETLVLANLVINADGTITATNRAGQAITTLERQTTTSVKKIEGGMNTVGLSAKRLADGFLNVRRLVSGLFAGFSVGGIVFALSNLVTSTIAATSAFKDLKESFIDSLNALIAGETIIERFSRKLKGLGVTTATDVAEKIKELREQIDLMQQTLSAGKVTSTFGTTGLGQILAGLGKGPFETKLTADEMRILSKEIANATAELVKLTKQFDAMGAAAKKEIPAAVDTGGPRTVSDLIFGPSKFGERAATDEFGRLPGLTAALAGAQFGVADLHAEFVGGQITIDEYANSMQTLIDRLTEFGATQHEIALLQEDFITDQLNEQSLAAIRLSDAYALAGIGLQGFAVGLVEIASGAETSSRKILASVLKAVGVEAAARGAFYVLEGIARGFSSYGFDATAYGLIKTGTEMIALGAALGAAAGKIAGKTSTGSGGSGRGFRETAPEATEPSLTRLGPQVTIIVDGGIFTGTPQELARTMTQLLREAVEDGA